MGADRQQQQWRPRGVICFTNPEQLPYILRLGVYGNVSRGDIPKTQSPQSIAKARMNRFGKLKDLLGVTAGDLVFLFNTAKSRLHGVWVVVGEPFVCSSPLFDPADNYPYRLNLAHHLDFPEPVPAMELRKLLNKSLLWSIRTFEREPNAPFASVNPISIQETQALLELFWKYNHTGTPTENLQHYEHVFPQRSVNFYDIVSRDMHVFKQPTRIVAGDFGTWHDENLYEDAIHCYLIYNLIRQSPAMQAMFGPYAEVLREIPVSVAGQKRPDLLLIYRSGVADRPSVYSLFEVKARVVRQDDLNQLLEYMRLFSERHALDLNSVEGIYIAKGFQSDALQYVQQRRRVEVERPVRLLRYKLSGNNLMLEAAS